LPGKVLLLMPFLMSPADALFLLAERPERPLHVGTLALLNPPEGTDGWDLREMVAAAQARERVAPLWRRRPHRSLSSLGQWYWRSDAEVDLGYHVRVSGLAARVARPSYGIWSRGCMAGCWTAPARCGSCT
jgi:diacylglycerol O-acyltransferase / wax synthase